MEAQLNKLKHSQVNQKQLQQKGNASIQNSNNSHSFIEQFTFIVNSLKKIQNFQNEYIPQIEQNMNNNQIDFAFGSMFGAFMGDSLGSYCEFRNQPFDENDKQLDKIMQMPGKGVWKIKSGQFTDDSQLAAHLLQALCKYNPQQQFQKQSQRLLLNIANQYVKWIKSQPFDVGNTTRKAFKILRSNLYEMKLQKQRMQQQLKSFKDIERMQYGQLLIALDDIKQQNRHSQSNGSLMRITPMAFFIALLLQQQKNIGLNCQHFEKFIKSQINMTHGSLTMLQISYIWVQLLVEIILRKKSNKTLRQIYDNFIQKYQNAQNIKEWIMATLSSQQIDATIDQGWARIAFVYGIKALKILSQIQQDQMTQQNYTAIIRKVISHAGDSDTNAAIVGGLVGAILGFRRLPVKYLKKQFSLQLDQGDSECSYRGQFYEPRRQFYKAIQLIQKISQ